jgi:hypothetical protein
MLYYILAGKRVGPVDNIALYSGRIHKSPCIALWESGKDLIVVTGKRLEPSVLRCLMAEDSSYGELLVDNPQICGSLGASLKEVRGYRFFVYKTRFKRVCSIKN